MPTSPVAAIAAETPLILTIDIGSSSTRAVLYDRFGRIVNGISAQVQYEIRTQVDGAAEANPDTLLDYIAHCIDTIMDQAGPLVNQIGAVAVDTLVSNILAIDVAGHALAPLITYADTRNTRDAELLRGSLSERAVQERTGCLLRTSYWPARLAWYHRTLPEIWRKTAHWITLGEYLELRLFGRCRTSFSVASWSGLLDRRQLIWDAPLLQFLGIAPEQLSALVDCDEPLSGLLEPYASRWPVLRSIPWFPAIGDGAAANIGSGCTNPSRLALTLGTTGAIRAVLAEVTAVPPGLWCYRVDRRHNLLGGATSEGGNVFAWVRDAMRVGDPAEVEGAVAAYPPDGHGLTVLPFFAGERSPDWAGNVQATLHGLTLATTPIAILRASLEAVAYRFAVIEQRVCAHPGCDHQLIASGGALAHSPAWSQIFADVLGRPVVVSAEPEATSRGIALLALHALGAVSSLAALPAADGPVYAPDAERHKLYQAAIERQRWLYERLIAPTSIGGNR